MARAVCFEMFFVLVLINCQRVFTCLMCVGNIKSTGELKLRACDMIGDGISPQTVHT